MWLNILSYLALGLSVLNFCTWRLATFLEESQFWTLRLRLSLYQPFLLASWTVTTSFALAATCHRMSCAGSSYLSENAHLISTILHTFSIFSVILGLEISYSKIRTRSYLAVRWKAWSGDSRTGIPSSLAEYIGSRNDWKILEQSAGERLESHPVERFSSSIFSPGDNGIECDPTDLLKAGDSRPGIQRKPQSAEREGVYYPAAGGVSVSLRWGERLGFRRRCSRGIISVPPHLLSSAPKLSSGLSGEALCLAFGILSRNKGLEPQSLVCNIAAKFSFRQWEECLFPHPAKTLRSFYQREVQDAFGGLGAPYVTAGTELALLLAGLKHESVGRWLERGLEHQDLELNHHVYALGATAADLQRLYRGQYAAMLISLGFAERDISVRPEITVFEAICQVEDVPLPKWYGADTIQARYKMELDLYGPALAKLIAAVV